MLDERGQRTELLVAPIDAYTPDPAEVKAHKQKKTKGGGAISYSGFDGS